MSKREILSKKSHFLYDKFYWLIATFELLYRTHIHLEQGSQNFPQLKNVNVPCFIILTKLFCHKSSTRSSAMFEHIQICIDLSTHKMQWIANIFFWNTHTTPVWCENWKHESLPGLSCYCSQISNIINIQWTVDKMLAAESGGTEIFRYFFTQYEQPSLNLGIRKNHVQVIN